ncbi:MAG: hypothetical protein ABL886_00685 [Rhodoglobus sp.]
MTTFHESQPQSRRAVRRTERGEPFENQEPEPQFYPNPSVAGDTWDTVARRAAQLPPAATRPDPSVVTGRRAAPAAPVPPAEPLNYATEVRWGASSEQQPAPPAQHMFRPRGTAVPPTGQAQVPAPAPAPEQSTFRVRDFSPGGGQSAQPIAPAQPAQPAPQAHGAPSDLNYHTEVRLSYEVPVAPAAVQSALPFEQTLTRRELRAQIASEEAMAGIRPSYDSPAPAELVSPPDQRAFPPAPQPRPDTALTNAMAEFDALTQRSEAAQRAAAEQQAAEQQAAARQAAELQAAAQQAAAQQAAWAAQQRAAQTAAQPAHQQAAPQQVVPQPEPQAAAAAWTPPLGHWAAQATSDEPAPYENTIARTVGGATATTSALVIPTIPGSNDIRGPLTGTGEIMLTGSIDLPRSFSSTGASARFDHEGIDAFFDAGDAEVTSTDSAPVRAIRAISTHNSGLGVTHTQKPKGTKGLTFLLVAASSMAVVVAGLLVTAFALNIF